MADTQKFKCLVGDFGIVIGLNENITFTYSDATHFITDLGNNIIRITRSVNKAYHVIYDADISRFVDLDGKPVATTVDGFRKYMSQQGLKLTGGRGTVINEQKVVLLPGTATSLGGFTVGAGLEVDASGKLSATATSEMTVVLGSESEMLALPKQEHRPIRAVRTDTNTVWYLNAGDDPSVLSNWLEGPSVQSMVLSYKGRTGVVEPESGDYDLDMVGSTDTSTGVLYHLAVSAGKLYVQNQAGDEKYEVAYQSNLASLSSDVQKIKDKVEGGYDSLDQRVSRVETKSDSNYSMLTKTGGVNSRLDSLESEKSTYALKSTIAKANGIAPLDSDSKVPIEFLPKIAVAGEVALTNYTYNKVNRAANTWYNNTSDFPITVYVLFAWGTGPISQVRVKNKASDGDYINLQTTLVGTEGNVSHIQQISFIVPAGGAYYLNPGNGHPIFFVAECVQKVNSTFVPDSQKGKEYGVAPLDANKKVPKENLPTTRNVVNGSVTSTKPLSIDCGNIRFTLEWTNAGEIKCSAAAISGSQVADLRSASMWGGGGVDSYSYDGATFTTTPTRFDAVYYTRSNECTFWRLRENGRMWEIKCFASGAGERVTLWSELIFDPAA